MKLRCRYFLCYAFRSVRIVVHPISHTFPHNHTHIHTYRRFTRFTPACSNVRGTSKNGNEISLHPDRSWARVDYKELGKPFSLLFGIFFCIMISILIVCRNPSCLSFDGSFQIDSGMATTPNEGFVASFLTFSNVDWNQNIIIFIVNF